MELLLLNTVGRFLAPLRCSAELCADLNWLESLLVTKYQVTNRKRVPTNEFRENEQKTVLPTQNKVSQSQKKSALPDMSSCLCFTLIADNSSAHHVSTGKLGGSHISLESGCVASQVRLFGTEVPEGINYAQKRKTLEVSLACLTRPNYVQGHREKALRA